MVASSALDTLAIWTLQDDSAYARAHYNCLPVLFATYALSTTAAKTTGDTATHLPSGDLHGRWRARTAARGNGSSSMLGTVSPDVSRGGTANTFSLTLPQPLFGTHCYFRSSPFRTCPGEEGRPGV